MASPSSFETGTLEPYYNAVDLGAESPIVGVLDGGRTSRGSSGLTTAIIRRGSTAKRTSSGSPVVEGSHFRADEGQGRLFCRTLLPKDALLAKVGGPGKEFWANGRNWEVGKWVKQENERIRQKTGKPMLLGNWRIEVSPGAR